MIGTSSTRAGRIWKFSILFTLILIVDDAATHATRASSLLGVISQKEKEKFSTFFCHSIYHRRNANPACEKAG
jgi:hypothetical protein